MTYTPAESALCAAARAVLTEQRIAGGVLPIPGTSMIVAFGEREQIAMLAAQSAQQAAGSIADDAEFDTLMHNYRRFERQEDYDKVVAHINAWARAATPAQPIAVSAPTDERAAFDKARATGQFRPVTEQCPIWYATQLRWEGWEMHAAEAYARAAAPVDDMTDKLLTIIAYAYQVAGAHDAPDHILDVLADPAEATDEQIEAMLPYVAAPVSGHGEPPKPVDQQMARWAIDGAIAYGRQGINQPPAADHWLMEYWQVGRQLAKLGETSAWDNVTPVDPAATVNGQGASIDTAAFRKLAYTYAEAIMKGTVPQTSKAWEALVTFIDSRLRSEDSRAKLTVEQEPKYGGTLFNRASGEAIPADEPVFIFRARDIHAVNLLATYAREVSNADHASAVWARVDDFKRFWNDNPDRMKAPDTALASTTPQKADNE